MTLEVFPYKLLFVATQVAEQFGSVGVESPAALLERKKEKSNRVAPVAGLLAHFGEMGEFVRVLNASGKLHDVMELGRGLFAQEIERQLAGQAEGRKLGAFERAATAEAFAGAFIALATWWLARGEKSHAAADGRVISPADVAWSE